MVLSNSARRQFPVDCETKWANVGTFPLWYNEYSSRMSWSLKGLTRKAPRGSLTALMPFTLCNQAHLGNKIGFKHTSFICPSITRLLIGPYSYFFVKRTNAMFRIYAMIPCKTHTLQLNIFITTNSPWMKKKISQIQISTSNSSIWLSRKKMSLRIL